MLELKQALAGSALIKQHVGAHQQLLRNLDTEFLRHRSRAGLACYNCTYERT
jgi:hypothetical protein